ncbi:SMI1/KNR4 family protein [Paenibacillus radicis (ex Xue et al. 2023)]|uniref:SMI1/KNR4 family protein n=1 Tax=Paenibacillus radicis (ex Xue et al. 2023) TaxID=2972489 RepID=A0ABT1YBL4_9BACL|nr:SMI1/KNR4 family protein [Paenibacillus radicis (ex Xue et al. 2023)]MCR8630586.1 SMI1/KNR4 family protein [Paenibacillus radicis (ex Xue et al. 2023)]
MYEDFLENFQTNTPISKRDIEDVETMLRIKFPVDYVEFMLQTNGGEGTIGESGYLRLWKIGEIVQGNVEYSVHELAPGLIIIGSDGGGAAYGYNFQNESSTLVEVDFIGMDIDSPFYSTKKFIEFIEYLFNN